MKHLLHSPRPVIVFGVRYPSLSAAAKALNCGSRNIWQWIRAKGPTKGRARYAD